MSERFEWDDTNSSGIWWSTNVSIRDECCMPAPPPESLPPIESAILEYIIY